MSFICVLHINAYFQRQLIELLLVLRCGDVDGIGYAVANGQQVVAVASGINAHPVA